LDVRELQYFAQRHIEPRYGVRKCAGMLAVGSRCDVKIPVTIAPIHFGSASLSDGAEK
jgi:hypothetical protein